MQNSNEIYFTFAKFTLYMFGNLQYVSVSPPSNRDVFRRGGGKPASDVDFIWQAGLLYAGHALSNLALICLLSCMLMILFWLRRL